MFRKLPLCIIAILAFFQSFSQITIKAKVIDKTTNEPLELVVVTDLSNPKNATQTDKEGNFVLKNNKNTISISVSFVGYKNQQINVGLDKNLPLLIKLEKGSVDLKEIVLTTHSNNLTTSHLLSSIDLNMQPVKSAQDMLRLVPGLFIAQHQGGGKAEQIFLRGFDADHGTDVNVSVDGMPVNLVSQAHGQGYADLHFLIPETVASYDFGKGPYYTHKGDFNTAGYVAYTTKNVLDKSMVKIEAGQYNTGRIVAMVNLLSNNAQAKGQTAYLSGEALYFDGAFDNGEHFTRYNLFGKFNTPIGVNNKLSLSLSTLSSGWRAAGDLPNRAIAEGYLKDRFGEIDSSQGGYTSRTNVNIKLSSKLKNNFTWENQAYYSYCFFNLISNFTFYYADPINGDEFGQHESRDIIGYNSKLFRQTTLRNATLTSSAGIGIRYDATHPSWLSHTLKGNFLNYIQLGKVKETNTNGYIDETVEKGKWLFNAGIRLEHFNFYYLNGAPASDTIATPLYNGQQTSRNKIIICPKINVQYTFNPKVQTYLKLGKGFHSNDARVVIANKGYQILPAAYGADIGINWKPVPHLLINTALWYLFLQQEFTYGADFGDESVTPGGKTVRKGIDFSARYQINKWLYADLNINLARPRSIDDPKGQDYLPLAPTFTSTAGLDFKFKNGFNGGISYRYLHNRAANENYSLTALGYFITDFTANYTTKKYEIGIAVENLFNKLWNESQFEYASKLKYETQPADEVSYVPGTPFFAKLKLSVFF